MDIYVCVTYAAGKFFVLLEHVPSYPHRKVQEWPANFTKIPVNNVRAPNVRFDTACHQGAETLNLEINKKH